MIGTQLRQAPSWLWLAVGMIVVATLSVLSLSGSSEDVPLSAHSGKPDGALAAYLWLERAGYRVQAENDPQLDHRDPRRETAMILSPLTDLSARRGGELVRWIRMGGRAVLATDGTNNRAVLQLLGISAVPAPQPSLEVVQPLLLAPPVTHLDDSPDGVLEGAGLGDVVADSGFGPVLVRRQEGLGQAWVLGAPQLLDNANLARAENRRLLLNLAGTPGGTVMFVEPGTATPAGTGSATSWITDTALGIALLFAVAMLVLYRGLSGLRLGPPIIPMSERHRPATEYVVSMAGLLRRAHKRGEVLARYQEELRRAVKHRYGVDDPALLEPAERERIEELLASPAHLSEEQLLRRVGDIVEYEEEMGRRRG